VLSLWDGPEHRSQAPPDATYLPGSFSKLRVLLDYVAAIVLDRPHVVLYGHVLLTPLSLLGRALCGRGRHVLFVHGVEVWQPLPPPWAWIVRRCLHLIVSVSAYTARRMQAAQGTMRARVRLLFNAVDPLPARAASEPPLHGTMRLISVSRLDVSDRDKHIDKIISAMPRIAERFSGVHCYIAGDGTWRPALEELARRLGVADRVHFCGYIDDPARDRLYANAHVFVLPSTQEGFGIVFLEAWQHGLPVVTAEGGAAPEIVRHGVDGLCVPPEAEAIARAVTSLLEDPQRCRRMGEEGRRRVAAEFSHARFRETLGRFLQETAPRAGAGDGA
jgi:glycosyltransferase involved in cell wall biosynthesis